MEGVNLSPVIGQRTNVTETTRPIDELQKIDLFTKRSWKRDTTVLDKESPVYHYDTIQQGAHKCLYLSWPQVWSNYQDFYYYLRVKSYKEVFYDLKPRENCKGCTIKIYDPFYYGKLIK